MAINETLKKDNRKENKTPSKLKDKARAILDIGNFTSLEPGKEIQKIEADAGLEFGLFAIHRFTFYGDEIRVGQINEVISVAPGETLEFVTETVRRTSREDEYESTQENESSRSIETKDVSELTDVVTRTLTESSRTSTSYKVSATCDYGTGEANVNSDAVSTNTVSSQQTAKKVKEATVKSSDRMKRSQRIKIRSIQDFTERNSTRRLIENKSDAPINIAAKAVLREETVVAQRIDLQLCIMTKIKVKDLLRTGKPLGVEARNDLMKKNDLIVRGTDEFAMTGSDWYPERGLSQNPTEPFTIQIPNTQQRDYSRDIKCVSFYIKDAQGTAAVVTDEEWGKDAFDLVDYEGPGNSVQILISMPSKKKIKPRPFAGGASFRFTFEIPTRYSDNFFKEVLSQQRESLDDVFSLSKRSQKDLRDEERAIVLGKVKSNFELTDKQFEHCLEYSSCWYEIPEPKVDATEQNQIDDANRSAFYGIGGKDSPARPFGAGFKGEWGDSFDKFSWDADVQRFKFVNADEIMVFIPVVAGKEGEIAGAFERKETKDPVNDMINYIKNRRALLANQRDSDGDRLDSGDIAYNAKTLDSEGWAENFKKFEKLVGGASTTEHSTNQPADLTEAALLPEDFYPVVDRFNITTPIEGFLLEKLDIEDLKGKL